MVTRPGLNVLGDGVNAEAIAGSVAATYWFLMLIGRLLGGVVGSKVSARGMLSVAATIGVVLTLAAIALSPATSVSMPVFNGAGGFGLVQVPSTQPYWFVSVFVPL